MMKFSRFGYFTLSLTHGKLLGLSLINVALNGIVCTGVLNEEM